MYTFSYNNNHCSDNNRNDKHMAFSNIANLIALRAINGVISLPLPKKEIRSKI